MEDSRNIIKAIDALTLKAGGEVVDSKNITEAIDNLKAVYDESAIGIDKTLTHEGLAADAKAVGDALKAKANISYTLNNTDKFLVVVRYAYNFSNRLFALSFEVTTKVPVYEEEKFIRFISFSGVPPLADTRVTTVDHWGFQKQASVALEDLGGKIYFPTTTAQGDVFNFVITGALKDS